MNLGSVVSDLQSELRNAERRVKEIKKAITTLSAFNTGRNNRSSTRKLSAAGRARIVAAQRARWAKARRGNVVPITTRVISAAGRARIAAAQRARWAKVRAGKKH
jgi:hypothetical protein